MIVGSRTLARIMVLAAKVAPTGCTVLITGETGTGKEVVARTIHDHGNRSNGPFLAVNISNIPENLIESQLFGHTHGAFTGADSTREGVFVSAETGTLLLDEVDDLPLHLQPKLLRALETKAVHPVGSDCPRPVDVRIIAATSQNLDSLTEQGKFRLDLFYRLNVIHLEIPPLRERPEDIPLLANYFIDRFSRVFRKSSKALGPDAQAFMLRYSWPGNVRELEHVIEHAVILSEGDQIGLKDFPDELVAAHSDYPDNLKQAVSEFKRAFVKSTLDRCHGDSDEAARELGISVSTLYRTIETTSLAS
ncbi:MAG TPA: sigma-54-dependent Fis family transcriptional regulator [Chromatiaceae bacterium]|jgi:transcriptional regulator with PAS, ATPase and Fis domain|nr:sigma-54-dependent Fis family transcriptional regulator [Chromatiaceae bacterium]HIB84363.1 sigma-54-dependent Fis family transcriptional regulator [Chromatiaceae bacterium]HIN83129.1 sigma-54-dependent Fis family transcriptional regulator [Chromatiales bacterium]HIO14153.1 sigma-54-dependent Fis family transcriptional regulator [Chromatiales bacterium]